jgi:vancomycin resistance protein YoaR
LSGDLMEILDKSTEIAEKKPSASKKKINWLVIAVLSFVSLVILSVTTFFIINAIVEGNYKEKIEPGTSVSGVYVGEMTRDQAKAELNKRLEGYNTRPISLQFKDNNWNPTLEQLGVTINFDASIDSAFKLSKTGDFFKDLRLFKLMSPQVTNIPLEVMVDEVKLRGYLSDISDRIRKDAIEPSVVIKEGKVEANPGAIGFNVNYDGTLEAIKKSLLTLKPSEANLLEVQDVPTVISDQEYNQFKDKITALIGAPLTIKFKEKTWTFDQNKLVSLIAVKRDTDPKALRHLTYEVNKAEIEKFVKNLSKEINQDPKDAVIAWKGKVVATSPSQDGQLLLEDKSVQAVLKQFEEPDLSNRLVELVVDVRKPAIDSNNLDALGMKEVVGQGVSKFAGSAWERATNIQVGAKWLTGKFIKPGETFSFLNAVGKITKEKGYVEGYAIMADQTVPEIGGGICQVSTTTFRAAFWAGLPIVERNQHLYRVGWYEEMNEPVGFEAAVYEPGVDLKFQNNTSNWLYLESYIEKGQLYVNLWGTKKPGMTVDLVHGGISNVVNAPPDRTEIDEKLRPGQKKQVDYARKGLTTSVTRVIKQDGVEVGRTTFGTRYQAWPNIFKVGPTPSPTPAPTGTPAPGSTPAPGGNNSAPPSNTAPVAPAPTTPRP